MSWQTSFAHFWANYASILGRQKLSVGLRWWHHWSTCAESINGDQTRCSMVLFQFWLAPNLLWRHAGISKDPHKSLIQLQLLCTNSTAATHNEICVTAHNNLVLLLCTFCSSQRSWINSTNTQKWPSEMYVAFKLKSFHSLLYSIIFYIAMFISVHFVKHKHK